MASCLLAYVFFIMKEFRFKKIDAFATGRSMGNPAGCVMLDAPTDISEAEMQQIARELKGFVNETGFLAPLGGNEYWLRYYSSECEVDFCGHATIAIMNDVARNLAHPADKLVINTQRGRLDVFNCINIDNSVYITAPDPFCVDKVPSAESIAKHLGIAVSDINSNLSISIINAGLTTLLVPIASLNATLGMLPDIKGLKQFCDASNVDIVEVFATDVHSPSSDFRSRVFAPKFGYLEDPATGSGNSALGHYLIKNNLWSKETITIEQNGERDDFNVVRLQRYSDGSKQYVKFGGSAVVRIDGSYQLW